MLVGCPYGEKGGEVEQLNRKLEISKPQARRSFMQLTTPNQSYAGEAIYVGIDVHKRTYTIAVRMKQQEVKRWTTETNPVKLAEQLKQMFAGAEIHSAYERDFRAMCISLA